MSQNLIPTVLFATAVAITIAILFNYRFKYADRKKVAEYLQEHHSALVNRWIPDKKWYPDPFPECHIPFLYWRRGIVPRSEELAKSWARVKTAVLLTSLGPIPIVVLVILGVLLWS